MNFSSINNRPIELLKALAESSKHMLGNESADTVVNEVLAIMGKTAHVDRTYVFKNKYVNGQLHTMNYEYEWCAPGVDPHLDNQELHDIEWSNFEDLKQILLAGDHFSVNTIDLDDDPTFKEALEMQNIKSVLFMPIFTDYEFWGYIGFDDCQTERKWDDADLLTLSSIAANLGAFLQRINLRRQLNDQHSKSEDQRNFYEHLINNIPADIVVLDANLRYRFVSSTSIRDKEIREWIIGKTDAEYCAYRNKPAEIAEVRTNRELEVLKTGVSATHEETFTLPDGTVKHYLRILHPVRNSDSQIEYLLGYGMDITDVKQRDKVILKQHSAIEKSPVGIALLDAEGKYYYMNRSHEMIFGYNPGELIGKAWTILYEQDEIDKIARDYFPILGSKGTWSGETLGRTKDGKPLLQEITLSAFEDGGLVCITRDITETKEELSKVQRIHQQLELAMQASKLGMWVWNVDEDVTQVSDAYLSMVNPSATETTISKEEWRSYIHPDDKPHVDKAIHDHFVNLKTGDDSLYKTEYRLKGADGNYFWVLSLGKVSKFDLDGNPTEMIGFLLDVNEQRTFDEKIKLSEKRYRDLVESLREIIFQIDVLGRWTFLNDAWTQITGHKHSSTLGKRASVFIHPDDIKRYVSWYRKIYKNQQQSINDEIRLMDADGKIVWVEFSASVHKNDAGEIIGMVGIAENITQYKAIEAELEQSKELLEKIISSIDQVIWSYDLVGGKLTYISPSCEYMTGVKDSKFYSGAFDWYELVEKEHQDKLKVSDDDMHDGKLKTRDIVYPISVGLPPKRKWVRDQAKLVFNDQGEPIRIDGVTTDITELVEAEQKLKNSEEKYRLISENIQDVISILDLEGNISYVSPSSIRITGYSYETLIHNNIFKVIHPDDVKRVFRFLKNTLNRKESESIVFRFIKANGEVMWMETLVSVFNVTPEGFVTVQASSRDVTIRKQAEIELTKALEKEKELGELKSRFVSMASHEFRTPLSTIRVGAELIRMFLEKDQAKVSAQVYGKINDKVDEILIDVDRISELMTDILTMGKIEASKVPFNPTTLLFSEFVEDYLQVEAPKLVHNRQIEFLNEAHGFKTHIDKKLMKQVMQNLISNAAKYSSPDTLITIKLTVDEMERNISLVVIDRGIGIPEKDLPYVFQSFFRAANAENIPGTGLGMPIIKLFTEMNKGTIDIRSKQGEGTTVSIKLPMVG